MYMITQAFAAFILIATLIAGCDATIHAEGGCNNDRECTNGRVCDQRECVYADGGVEQHANATNADATDTHPDADFCQFDGLLCGYEVGMEDVDNLYGCDPQGQLLLIEVCEDGCGIDSQDARFCANTDVIPDPIPDEDCPTECIHGVCIAGACACDFGFAGDACDTCAVGFQGYPACQEPPENLPDTQCVGELSEDCGSCGQRTRSCVDGVLGEWGACRGEGVCSPGLTQSCGSNGEQSCTMACDWGSCAGETFTCSGPNTQACGCDGEQQRTCDATTGSWSSWSSCAEPSAPLVASVSPLSGWLDQSVTVTISGCRLPSSLAAWIDQCDYFTFTNRTSTSATFTCTPRWSTGLKQFLIKDAPGGFVLWQGTFRVQ